MYYVQLLNKIIIMDNKHNYFNILRQLGNLSKITQRKLASNLGFSLGKLNYCLNALRAKGLVKLKNFKNNKTKIGYTYLLTPKGISAKTKLTIRYMKLKMQEYDELKDELKYINNEHDNVDNSKNKK